MENNNHFAFERDRDLVTKTLAGQKEAFAELIALHKNRVTALGMSFFKNETDTEDFVQDVFIKAFTKLSLFRGDSLFSTWLTRIAYNTAINSVNRRKEYVSLSDENLLPDFSLTPEENQLKELTREAVRLAVKELPENYAVCLDMYFFYDMPYTEISSITGFPVNTIKSNVFRAKKILKDKILEQGLVEK